jgi:hypothetical protein
MNRSKKTFRKSKKSNRSKKNKKVNISKKHKKMGGGCGCGNNMHGGNLPPSQYYYSLNDHNNDPIAPANIIDSRQQPNLTGGRKRIRKMKGGMNGTSFLSTLTDPIFNPASMTNPIMSYGNVAGGLSANNLLIVSKMFLCLVCNIDSSLHRIRSIHRL